MRISLLLVLLVVPLEMLAEDTSKCFSAIYALNENRLDEAIEQYSQCIADGNLESKNLIVAYNDRGNAYGKKKDYKAALADFNKVIELNPDDSDAFYNRGLTYKKLHKNILAFNDYSAAIKLNPKYAKSYNNRGAIYGQQGKFSEAINDFNHAIFLAAKNASAYFNRGLAYYSLGDYKKAIADLEKAIELDPQYIKAYENLAWLRATCPEDEYRDGLLAMNLAKKARFMRPEGTATLYDIIAAAHASSGSFEDAVRYGELALETADSTNEINKIRERLSLYQNNTIYTDHNSNKFLPNS